MRLPRLLPAAFLAVLLIHAFSALASDPIQFSPADSYTLSATQFRMTSGDFNKDGWPDLAVVQDNTMYSVLMNNGAGGFTTATYTVTGSRLKDVAVVNLAGDTIPDLMMSDYLGFVRVFNGVGNGTFTLSASASITVNRAQGIAAGDFNGDGYPDAAVCMFNLNKVGVLLGDSGGSLGAPTYYTTGSCDDLAVGLVNADGYQDIVTANWSSDNITVLLGNGDGTFATPANIPCGNDNTDVALADIDHDGKLDAVVASYANKTAVIMLGDGLGGFSLSQALSVITGPQQVRVADFNQDGFLDIVTANAGGVPGMALLQATGYNTFMAVAPFHPDQAANGLAIADFNKDTGPDVATSHLNNSTVRVMKVVLSTDTDGDGMPDWWENQNACLNPLVGDSALDADSDGLRNIQEYALHTNPCLADTDGDGLSDWAEVNSYSTDPTKADTDGDGMPDNFEVLHVCLSPVVNDANADPDGDVGTNLSEYQHATDPCVFNDTDGDGMPDGWEARYVSCGLDPNLNDAGLDPDGDARNNLQEFLASTNPCLANDADRDGMPDDYEVLHACLNPGINDGNVDADADLGSNLTEYRHGTDPCAFTDTDGDGMPDGWESQYPCLNRLVNDGAQDANGNGVSNLAEYQAGKNPCLVSFHAPDSYTIPATAGRINVGDFNRDGYPDLVVVLNTNRYSILINNGAGGFSAATYSAGINLRDAVAVNLAGDSVPDLLMSDSDGNLRVFIGLFNGNGTFYQNAIFPLSSAGEGIAAGDFNGDGYPDAAVCLPTASKVAVLLGTSDGGFGTAATYTTGACVDLAVGLVNADGYQDLVTANGTSNNLSVLLGNGDGTFAAATNIAVGGNQTDVALADIDHDGQVNAVVAAYASKSAVIMLGDGAGGFTISQSLSVVTGPNQVRVADFNSDGFLEIATANSSAAPGLAVLQATGPNRFMPALTFHPDQRANGLAIADFNHDGAPDLATTHPGDNTVRVMTVFPTADIDGDLLPDWWENQYACMNPLAGDTALDPDGDGLKNLVEFSLKTNPCLADTDGDGLSDFDEFNTYHTDPLKIDTDGDLLRDDQEINIYFTDPLKADTDNDGISDYYEVLHTCLNPFVNDAAGDSDGDLESNLNEYQWVEDACVINDADGDGMPNAWELLYVYCGLNKDVYDADNDADFDGLTNRQEYLDHTNPCVADTDTDGDGMPDAYEILYLCLNPYVNDAGADPDGDFLTNLYEFQHGTHPCVFNDFDHDGMPDGWELAHPCMNRLVADAGLDYDHDSYSNLVEYQLGLDPCSAEDTDSDGMPDGWEDKYAACGLNKNVPDSSQDPDADSVVNLQEFQTGTNPCSADTDGDNMPDGWEKAHACMKPAVADGGADYDHDQLTNLQEYQLGTDPCAFSDSDADGMPDAWEMKYACLNRLLNDAGQDPDTDAMTNLAEYQAGTDPCVWDTDGDGLPDGWEVQFQSCGFDPLSYWSEFVGKVGADLRVTNDPAHRESPSLSWTGTEFGVSWEDYRDGNREIYFSRLSASGSKIGADIRVTSDPSRSQAPSISWTGSEFGVAWMDFRNDDDQECGICNYEIYFARLTADGAKIGADLRVTYDPGISEPPSLVWTGSEFGVSWCDSRDGYEIHFARISSAGVVTGADQRVTNGPDWGDNPSLSWTGSEFGVVAGGVGFTRLTADGSPIGSLLSIGGVFPSLSWTGSEFGVSWAHFSDGNDEIYFARISPAGTKIGADLRLTSDPNYSWHPSLSWTGSEFGVSWYDDRDGNSEIYFARVSAAGIKLGGDVRLTNNPATSEYPSLAWTGSEFGLSWCDNRNGYSKYEIYFARISLDYTDKDGDGLREDQEYAFGTNPCGADSDGDGLTDSYEVNTSFTNPLAADSDGDGLSDYMEAIIYHTNPGSWDSDGDRLPDKFEIDNAGHAGGGLDPMNALDGAGDFDGDGNSNVNEYYNGSDPWTDDPAPGVFANPGCYYWADGDGDGIPAPSDLLTLRLAIAGVAQTYREILPHGIDTLDLDRDGYAAPADLILLKLMVAGAERPGGYDSQASALEVVAAPTGSVAMGSTTHVTVSVHSVGGTHPYAPGFGVVFTVVSGNAVLLGGDGTADGEAAGNRYDFSMEAALGARANVVVMVTGPGPVTIGAKVPGCGTNPNGRWNNEVVLSPGVVINP